ncbi:hypothetical protein DH2020_016005 [Rehmannia glutinosa]|uniref:Uncharacterized protein n=1 Tax=Rehmannia glutinosa TaxID=99300 RepID=A0ABR0WU95_REHGL
MTVHEVFEAKGKCSSSKDKTKEKSHKSHKEKSHKDKNKGSSLKDPEPKDGPSSKKPRTDPTVDLMLEPDMDEQLAWLDMCEGQLLRQRELERSQTPQEILSAFNASLRANSVLETHAGEDSFELYKHTLLETDQFALIPFDTTRLEELIGHNNFTNNALLHHLSLRAANWKATCEDQNVRLEKLSKKMEVVDLEKARAIDEARREATEQISSLKSQVHDLTEQLSKAHLDLDKAKTLHVSEPKESYNLGRARGYQEYTASKDHSTAIQKARLEGVRAFLSSYSYENLVARRAAVYLFDRFKRYKDLAISEGAFKEDFDLSKLDPFRVDDLEKPEGDGPDGEVMIGGDGPDEEEDEFSKVMRSHISTIEQPRDCHGHWGC